MRCEKDVCGFVARPGYVNKDHCPALLGHLRVLCVAW
jgi:hypothetical protein